MTKIAETLAAARQHHVAGRLDDAQRLYRTVLAADPDNASATHLLGGVLFQLGQQAEAIELLKRSVALAPQSAAFYGNLGSVCTAAGRHEEAADASRRLLRIAPQNAAAHTSLGRACYRLGQLDEARRQYERAIQLAPNDAEVRNSLGVVLANLGAHDAATDSYRAALRLKPQYAEAENNLGVALRIMAKPAESLDHCLRAIELKPEYADAHNNAGCAHRQLGQHEAAIKAFRESIRLDTRHRDANNNLGASLVDTGELTEAVDCFRQSLRLTPTHAFAWRNLGELAANGHYQFSDDEIEQLERLASAAEQLSPPDERQVHFTLASLRERQGDLQAAFLAYKRANDVRFAELQKSGMAFDATTHARGVDRVISIFTADVIRQLQAQGSDRDQPVFVLGMPRSGTSLVEQVLASHPQVYGAGELPDIRRLSERLPALLNDQSGYPDCVLRADGASLLRLAEDYLQRLNEISGGGAERVVDKMPENYFYLGLIAVLFPKATVIHCQRDPMDVCLACYRRNFENIKWASRLQDIGAYYCQYKRLMVHWKLVLGRPMIEVSYEHLVEEPEAVSRQLVSGCRLDWDEACLTFHENRRPVRTASQLQVRQPIYTSARGRWERYRAHLGPLVEALGQDGPNSGRC